MSLIIERSFERGRPRPGSDSIPVFPAGEEVNAWWKRERASLDAWRAKLSNLGGIEFSPEAVLLDVGESEPQNRTIFLEDNGHIGESRSWIFVKPDYDAVSVASINRSVPGLNSQIDYLARSLKFEPELFHQGIARAHTLLANTTIDRSSDFDEALKEHTAALELDNGWSIRLRRFQPYFNRANVLIGAVIEYYSKVGIREPITLKQGLILGRMVCRSLIYERGIREPQESLEQDNAALLFTRLFSLVLFLSSHAAEGDSYSDAEHTATTP